MARGMDLSTLLRRAIGPDAAPPETVGVRITDICGDSRRATNGSLFVAVAGGHVDGAGFIADAVRRGASAVATESKTVSAGQTIVIRVADARLALARLAAAFHRLDEIQDRGEMRAVGITGTNGKSTIAHMVRAILRAAGRRPAMLGTIEYDLVGRLIPADLTTPDPVTLTRHIVEAHEAGARDLVMEVSSHSLAQRRTDGIRYDVGVFTNLTQDHLDYHPNWQDYLSAKRRLFEGLAPQATAIINADDPASATIVQGCRAAIARYGIENRADLFGEILSAKLTGCRFLLKDRGEAIEIETNLVGRHNVSNALAAAAVGRALGIDLATIRTALAGIRLVPGRLQRVEADGLGFDVFVDYAHTEDALRNVLRALRPFTRGRLWCVFGCGGDRDRMKRPLMARAVAEGADAFVITSDNPRTEDPLAILADIERGLEAGNQQRVATIPDRAKAIGYAIERLTAGDALVIAGKGHEDYQILGTSRIDFDDVETARAAIEARAGRTVSQ